MAKGGKQVVEEWNEGEKRKREMRFFKDVNGHLSICEPMILAAKLNSNRTRGTDCDIQMTMGY